MPEAAQGTHWSFDCIPACDESPAIHPIRQFAPAGPGKPQCFHCRVMCLAFTRWVKRGAVATPNRRGRPAVFRPAQLPLLRSSAGDQDSGRYRQASRPSRLGCRQPRLLPRPLSSNRGSRLRPEPGPGNRPTAPSAAAASSRAKPATFSPLYTTSRCRSTTTSPSGICE